MPLTDVQIRKTKPNPDSKSPIRLADGNGLWLVVSYSGAKYWQYRYKIGRKENTYSVGEYPGVSLSDAREVRKWARELVKQGVHPTHQRKDEQVKNQADKSNTFKSVALEWIQKKKVGWTPYYLRQVENMLGADVYPAIGKMPIRAVTAAHLLDIITKVEGRGAETVALLIRQWCSAIFRYGVATLRADNDPASALKGAIHRPKTVHSRPLSREEIRELLKALEKFGGYRTTVIALRLMLLTFVRTVELRAATWSEFDLSRGEWRIPAERMKMREPHFVPLSRQAIKLLQELHTLTGNREYLFPNYRSPRTCMTATTLNRALERMGFNGKGSVGFSGHGFRATASTLLNEMGFRSEVIERQLAHAERNKVRASYNQAEYMEERRSMMQQWADFIDQVAE
jgi:integrase